MCGKLITGRARLEVSCPNEHQEKAGKGHGDVSRQCVMFTFLITRVNSSVWPGVPSADKVNGM